MKINTSPFLRNYPQRPRRGMALVLTLGSVVLLTGLVLAFFARSQIERQIAFSESNLIKSDLMSRSALDIIVGELGEEIADLNYSTPDTVSGKTLYQPKTAVDWVLRPLGVSNVTGSLLRCSAPHSPIRQGGTIMASDTSIGVLSLNGRSISSSRWFTSASHSPKLGSQATLPTWLYFTRANGVKAPTVADAKNPSQGDYVIGRFAYSIYDIGGLLDATVAGFPISNPFTTPIIDYGLKSSPTYANLTSLGISGSSIDQFIIWRNGITATSAPSYLEWAAGIKNISGISNPAALWVAQSGHRFILNGDNAILSRHDLLNNPYLRAAPNLLTHFSRSLNGPTFVPTSITATNSNLGIIRFTRAGTVTHYLDDGTTTTYSVALGDPMLQRRFSLAKLAWIDPSGPTASTAFKSSLSTTERIRAIRDCFGLDWDSANAKWNYIGNGASIASSIKTLVQIQAESEPREPNFFELLKAGILDASVGVPAARKTYATDLQRQLEAVPDLQILRIGANVIDCADSDNFPTTLALRNSGADVTVHGIEDLPYLAGLQLTQISQGTVGHSTYLAVVVVPIFFNPNAPSFPVVSPQNIRVTIANGLLQDVYCTAYGNGTGQPFARPGVSINLPSALGARSTITISNVFFEALRDRVGPYQDNSSPSRLSALIPSSYVSSADAASAGFILYDYTAHPGMPTDYVYNGGSIIQIKLNNFLVTLNFQDASGNWRVYDTLVGNEAFGTGTGIGYAVANPWINVQPRFPLFYNNTGVVGAFLKFDPRTTRFGIGSTPKYQLPVSAPITSDPGFPNGITDAEPFGGGTLGGGGPSPGYWAEGGKTSWSDSDGKNIKNVKDRDSITRPADAWLDSVNSNLFRKLDDNSRRPVILQRPFRSVAELGYVFRDSPWKTLNFFDASSGDKALLDLFSVTDEPTIIAGRVSLNTTQSLVHEALLSHASQTSDGSAGISSPNAIATAYNIYAYSGGNPASTIPISVASLTDFLSSLPVGGSTGLDGIKYRREAVVRSLASNVQSRTWNLLIDVVAQSGHYPASAATLDNFVVEGESRYWLSLAIDRLTGQIIDRQLESANR